MGGDVSWDRGPRLLRDYAEQIGIDPNNSQSIGFVRIGRAPYPAAQNLDGGLLLA
jgi:hypothetical protein